MHMHTHTGNAATKGAGGKRHRRQGTMSMVNVIPQSVLDKVRNLEQENGRLTSRLNNLENEKKDFKRKYGKMFEQQHMKKSLSQQGSAQTDEERDRLLALQVCEGACVGYGYGYGYGYRYGCSCVYEYMHVCWCVCRCMCVCVGV